MVKNAKFGMILGTFLGSILGSTSTILVMKKLKKLEEKQFKKDESEAINEVEKYYENKINQLKNGGMKIDYSTKIEEKKESKITVVEGKKETDKDILTEKESPITNPKFLYQDRLAEEEKNKVQTVDYSKIAKSKYQELSKEYDREPLEVEDKHEHIKQITQDNYEHSAGYVKMEVMYYEQNGIFATLDDMIVDHLSEEYFGLDTLGLIGSPQASLDGKSSQFELYLRDEEIHTDYHIIYNGTEDFDHLGDCRI